MTSTCGPRGLPGESDFLCRNDGKGRFEEVGLLAGGAVDENGGTQGGMGVALGTSPTTGS